MITTPEQKCTCSSLITKYSINIQKPPNAPLIYQRLTEPLFVFCLYFSYVNYKITGGMGQPRISEKALNNSTSTGRIL